MKKLITFTVPCYNSQEYMRKCVDSLLVGGDEVEIIIVNDGSKDATLNIANDYAARFPSVVRVVDKENGGHGSGVNVGLKLACGLYFKVVDSDDWVDEAALKTLIDKIKRHKAENVLPDAYVVNYVYEHAADGTRHFCRYADKFPEGEICDWDSVKKFHFSHMLLMHSLVYSTAVLRKSGLTLPEHTFYVDDVVSYTPLPFVNTLCYLNVDFYRYFIGRADQSINVVNMVKRYEQMIRVMQILTDAWSLDELKGQSKGLRRYMLHSLANYMMTTILFVCAEDSPERRKAYDKMWRHINERDAKLYKKLRYRTYVIFPTLLPWKIRGWVQVRGYRALCKRIKLG